MGEPESSAAAAAELAARKARQEERRRSFDSAAAAYDQFRPGYPAELFDALEAKLPPPARVLEIASGTGHATLPLAQRGYQVHCIELGERLADFAREKLAGFAKVSIEVGRFEECEVAPASADLVVCASAFHWLEHARALPRIASALRPSGWLALLWTSAARLDAKDDPFTQAARPIYQRHAPELLEERARESAPARMSRAVPGILLGNPHFTGFSHQPFHFRRSFNAGQFLGLLGTYSNYLTLPEATRAAIFSELRELIDRQFGGKLEREFHSALQLARRI